jgi:spermidine synthase
MGQVGAAGINVDDIALRLGRPDHAAAKQSLNEVGFGSMIGLLATYSGRGPNLHPWLASAPINRDRNLRLQYLAGMGRAYHQGGLIHNQMLSYLSYPDDLFLGSAVTRDAIRYGIEEPR